jgi:hypothetical protein
MASKLELSSSCLTPCRLDPFRNARWVVIVKDSYSHSLSFTTATARVAEVRQKSGALFLASTHRHIVAYYYPGRRRRRFGAGQIEFLVF